MCDFRSPRAAYCVDARLREVNTHVDPIQWRAGKRFGGPAWMLDQIRVHLAGRRGFPAPPGHFAADVIHHAPGGHLDQPGPRIFGNALPRPLLDCRH